MVRVRFQVPLAALSDRARKAFQLAHQEAQRLNHASVGTEHLLLGLAKESLSPAALALRRAGFGLAWLRLQVEHRRPPGPDTVVLPGTLPYAEDLEEFLADSMAAAESSGVFPLTPELLLSALVEESSWVAGQILQQRRLARWWLRRHLRSLA